LAALPKGLSDAEVQQLVDSLGWEGPSARRADAMVRCALDLGLRSGEIATLGLDDIDWQAGTITLRRTKSRREDTLPLPPTTGQAIVDYLLHERPPSANRAVFVRRIAPCDRPLGADCVRKSIRQAYARAGLPYTRSHLLRHTMASRLLASGSSLKEVADVLRHRSLNTTLIYAKLDSRTLTAVALPWPGGAA
jgi:integrase